MDLRPVCCSMDFLFVRAPAIDLRRHIHALWRGDAVDLGRLILPPLLPILLAVENRLVLPLVAHFKELFAHTRDYLIAAEHFKEVILLPRVVFKVEKLREL